MSEDKKTDIQQLAKDVKEVSEKVDTKKMKSDTEQIEDITGSNGKKVIAKHSGKEYHLVPVALKDVPKVTKLTDDIQNLMAKGEGKTDQELLGDGKCLNSMSELISLGVKEGITPEQVMDEFSLGNFPQCWEITLDINDFLLGMRNLFLNRMRKK